MMKDALAIHRWLLAHQVHHEIVRLPRPLTCADDLPEILGAPPAKCVAVSVFEVTMSGAKEPVAVISTVDTPPRATIVGAVLRAHRARPASDFVVNTATDYAAGLVCPLLLPEDLTVLIDKRLIDRLGPDESVYTVTGERRMALRLRALHLFNLVAGKPVDLASLPRRGLATLTSPTTTT